MRRIVFDIETYGCNMEDLTESQQEYLQRDAMKERDEELRGQKLDDAERFLSLYPLTAKVVAIGIYDINTQKPYVYYESDEKVDWQDEEKITQFRGMSEKEMLERFWEVIKISDQVITFNGRNFDIPFMLMRSAKLGVKPTKDLMGYRYSISNHVDLLEQFTFYGVTRKFNLDFYCTVLVSKLPNRKRCRVMRLNIYMMQDVLKI
jgi:DNA polymerase elongation subunit (family B)